MRDGSWQIMLYNNENLIFFYLWLFLNKDFHGGANARSHTNEFKTSQKLSDDLGWERPEMIFKYLDSNNFLVIIDDDAQRETTKQYDTGRYPSYRTS